MMQAARPTPEPDFDRVAHFYRWAEYLTLGPLLQQTRKAHLSRLFGCRQALVFGDGDGRFLACALARYPALHAVAIDTSSVMLRLLRARCLRASPTSAARLTTLHGSALQAPIPPVTDLIVTHFFLDCLTQAEVDGLVAGLSTAVQPGTLWLLSDFGIPGTPVLRHAAQGYVRALYFAFRLLTGLRVHTLPDPQAALAQRGFRLLAGKQRLFGLLYSELWVFDGPDGPNNPAECAHIHNPMASLPQEPANVTDPERFPADVQPDPEPPVPSLPEPDPGVFHHEVGTSSATENES